MSEEWIEIEGRNRKDAIERACNALNTTESYLEYEVMGGNGAKIRARKVVHKLEPEPDVRKPAPREDHRDAAPRTGRGDRPHPTRTPPTQKNDDEITAEFRTNGADHEEREPADEREDRFNVRSGSGEEEIEEEEIKCDPTEQGLKAKEMLEAILKFIDDSAGVEIQETNRSIELDIKSNGSGLLIGKHGQTLEALQHLVSKMGSFDPKEGKRLQLDSEGYRGRRKESLASLAHNVAARVRRERRPVTIDPMSPMDRRVIHLALKNDPDVVTRSVGEGRDRKVMVCPKFGGRRDGGRGRGRGRGRDGDRGGMRSPEPRDIGEPKRRRSGPPARMHDSFDTPPEPKDDHYIDEMESPRMADIKTSEKKEE